MYMLPEMINMGLKSNGLFGRVRQKFPTEDHRIVAENLALCNDLVFTRDALTEIVQEVIKIPVDKIKTIKLQELPQTVRQYIRIG